MHMDWSADARQNLVMKPDVTLYNSIYEVFELDSRLDPLLLLALVFRLVFIKEQNL